MEASVSHSQKAQALFTQGFNCAQAVLGAFEDITGLEPALAARLASSFGGGLGRMREVCGAVSGAAMVLGIACGYSDPEDYEAKKAHYRRVQEFARRFRAENGSIVCRELLSGCGAADGNVPERRSEQYYRKRPCKQLVGQAADILDEMLMQEKISR